MANPYDEFDKQPKPSNPYDEFDSHQPERTVAGTIKDTGVSLAKGVVGAGQGLFGLADIPTGGRVGKALDAIGIKPKDWQDSLDKQYSPAQQAANKKVDEANGFFGKAGAMLDNPSTIFQGIVETIPSVAAGGVIGKGALAVGSKLAPKVIGGASRAAQAIGAGAFGEGSVSAGQTAEEIRGQSEDGLLTAKQSGLAALSGVGTAAFGVAGGALAKKFGLADVDTWAVGMSGGKKKGFADVVKGVVGGGISEGVFEELPQTVQETILQNVALDKPWSENLPESMAQAIILGGAMGASANLRPGRGEQPPATAAQPSTVTDYRTPENIIRPESPFTGTTQTVPDDPIIGDIEKAFGIAATQQNGGYNEEQRRNVSISGTDEAGQRTDNGQGVFGNAALARTAENIGTQNADAGGDFQEGTFYADDLIDDWADTESSLQQQTDARGRRQSFLRMQEGQRTATETTAANVTDEVKAILPAIRKMREEIRGGAASGSVQDREGNTIPRSSSYPDWFKQDAVKAYNKKFGENISLSKGPVLAIIKKVEEGKPLTVPQQKVFNYLKDVATGKQAQDPAVITDDRLYQYSREGFKLDLPEDVAVGNLMPGDEVIVEQNGVPDKLTHKGYDDNGNAILQDGVTIQADPFEQIKVLAKKQRGELTKDDDASMVGLVKQIRESGTQADLDRISGEVEPFFKENPKFSPYREMVVNAVDARREALRVQPQPTSAEPVQNQAENTPLTPQSTEKAENVGAKPAPVKAEASNSQAPMSAKGSGGVQAEAKPSSAQSVNDPQGAPAGGDVNKTVDAQQQVFIDRNTEIGDTQTVDIRDKGLAYRSGRQATKPTDDAGASAPADSQPQAVQPKEQAKQPWEMTLDEAKQEFDLPLSKAKRIVDEKVIVHKSRTTGAIDGFWEGDKFTVTDGNHRVTEALKRGDATIKAKLDGKLLITHKKAVEKALSENKPVPAAVLADYPDLAAKYAGMNAKEQRKSKNMESGNETDFMTKQKPFNPLDILTGKEKPAPTQEERSYADIAVDSLNAAIQQEQQKLEEIRNRKYKKNDKTVSVGGDRDSLNSGSTTVDAANARRKKRMIADAEVRIAKMTEAREKIAGRRYDDDRALDVMNGLSDDGIFVQATDPPTLPEDQRTQDSPDEVATEGARPLTQTKEAQNEEAQREGRGRLLKKSQATTPSTPSSISDLSAKQRYERLASVKSGEYDRDINPYGLRYNDAQEQLALELEEVLEWELEVIPWSMPKSLVRRDSKGRVQLAGVPRNGFETAERIAKVLGKRIVWANLGTDYTINGLVIRGGRFQNLIFIDPRAERPYHVVYGHELAHHLEKEHPQAYKELTDIVYPFLQNIPKYRSRLNLQSKSDEYIRQEIVADLMGDAFADPSFWNEVAAQSPGTFRSIANKIREWINGIINRLTQSGFGSDEYTKDLKATRKALAQLIVKTRNEKGRAELAQQAGKFFSGDAMMSQQQAQFKPVDTTSANFRAWFGDSVVTENGKAGGKPLVVYHGTWRAGYDEFLPASHFTENPEYASQYTEPSASSMGISGKKEATGKAVYPVYVSIKKPFDTRIRKNAKLYNTFTNTYGNGTPLSERGLPDWTDSLNLIEWIEETGQDFDGLILDEGGTPDGGHRGISIVPLQPTQIKSAISNTGAFSKTDPRIKFSAKGATSALPATPQFKSWHGDSVVKVPVYHGSPTFGKGDNFTFDTDRATGNTSSPGRGLGTFVTENRNEALGYAGASGEVQTMAVRIENPLELYSWELPQFKDAAEARAFRRRKQLQDYDGIHIIDEGHWVAFHPNQLKSIDKNSGDFSRVNNDIRYSVAARVKGSAYTDTYTDKEFFGKIKRGTKVDLVREPTNAHDANAIKVMLDGRHIGYVAKEKAAEVAPQLDGGAKLEAVVAKIIGRDDKTFLNILIGTEKEVKKVKQRPLQNDATAIDMEIEAQVGQDIFEDIQKNGINPVKEKVLFEEVTDNPPPPITDKIKEQIKALPKAISRNMLGGLTLRHLREIYGNKIAPIREYYAATQGMDTDSNRIMNKAEGVYTMWAKLDKKVSDQVSFIMSQATFHGSDPANDYQPAVDIKARMDAIREQADAIVSLRNSNDPDKDTKIERREKKIATEKTLILQERKRRAAHDKMVEMFNALPREAKDVYTEIREMYTSNLNELRTALEKRMKRTMPNKDAEKMAMSAIRLKFEQYLREGPYFPLSRFGDYVVITTKGDEREVHTFDYIGERNRFIADRSKDGWMVKAMTSKEYTPQSDGASTAFVEDIINAINKAEGMSQTDKNLLMDEVNQIFIKAMPDLSHRKHFIHRKKVEGYSRDQLRAFAQNMQHAAHHIARVNHSDKMLKAVVDLDEMVRTADEGDLSDITDLRNELVKRNEQILNPKISPVAQALTSLGFVFNIGPSIASALVNMSQTPLVAFPVLGARHGSRMAMNVLSKVSAQYFTSPWTMEKGFDMSKSKSLSKGEKDMLAALEADGTLDISLARSLAQATGPDAMNFARSKHGHTMVKAMRIVSYPFHVAELANRQITAVAAYRLAKSKGMGEAQAIEYAKDIVTDSHFDYSASNRARFMEGNWQRVLFLFKQYSLQMSFLLGRSAYQAMKGETKEVKDIARKQLTMILGGHFLVAGMFGLPVVGTIGEIMNFFVAALGDDDEPWDWEVELRKMLAKNLGKDAGEAITHGAWRLIPGLGALDISSRLSLGDLWLRSDDKETEGKDTWNKYVNLFLGPLASNGATMAQGLSAMADGKFDRGVEMMLPKFLKDGLKAARYTREGVKSWNDATLIDDLNSIELFGQALGFSPSRVAEMYEGKGAIKNLEARLLKRRERLINGWISATKSGDAEEVRAKMQEIMAFSKKNPEFRITGDTLKRSMRNRAKVQQQTKQGLYLPSTRNNLREEGDFVNI